MATPPVQHDALQLLRELVGSATAEFHDGQLEAIDALVTDRSRALVVQRTGWGKSAVYFIATRLRRSQGAGPTILISPLLALMRDQVAAAARAGVTAVTLNSANMHEWDAIEARIGNGAVDIILVSPERLNNPSFRERQLPALVRSTGLLVIDEAHCISDWGHDFRPDYRRIRDLITTLTPGTPVLATTATANSRVVTDVAEQLSHGSTSLTAPQLATEGPPEPAASADAPAAPVVTIRGALARRSLRLGVLTLSDSRARIGWLVDHLNELTGSGIIYALTVSAAEDTARILRDAGYSVRAYTGRTDTAERAEAEDDLKANRVKALVATSALGMGFDKPDLGFVVHLGAPSSPVAYYQQVGRAGRATETADVVLLPGAEDEEIWRYFATASMPSEANATAVLTVLGERASAEGHRPISTPALESLVNLKRSPLELLLKVLDVDGAVSKVSGGWITTGKPWSYDAERYSRIAAARVHEQQSMLDYEATTECRMVFIQNSLDDTGASPCGRCDNCAGVWYPTNITDDSAAVAATALDRVGVTVEPRSLWPTGASSLGLPVKGKIATNVLPERGRALTRLTDLGWGGTARALLSPAESGSTAHHTTLDQYSARSDLGNNQLADQGTTGADREVPASVLAACARVLGQWDWAERPVAVVSVPSRSRPRLVGSLATGLAQLGRLPYLGSLDHQNGGPNGGPGGNSAYRLAAVWDRFRVGPDLLDALAEFDGKPLLLVDDLVDSRWTITVAAAALRRATGNPVLPFVLAVSQ
jgi:ATP-dependent DNA helicase RecQ